MRYLRRCSWLRPHRMGSGPSTSPRCSHRGRPARQTGGVTDGAAGGGRGPRSRGGAALGLVRRRRRRSSPATAAGRSGLDGGGDRPRASGAAPSTAGCRRRCGGTRCPRCCSPRALAGLADRASRSRPGWPTRRWRSGPTVCRWPRCRRRRAAIPAAELRETLAAVVAAVAEAGRMRERPLWAIATDSLANQLLALGPRARRRPRRDRAGRPAGRGDRRPAAGAPLRRRRRGPVHPPGLVLPGGRAAGRVAVHLVPAPAAGRARGAAGAGRPLVLPSGQEEHRVAELVPAGSARRPPRA